MLDDFQDIGEVKGSCFLMEKGFQQFFLICASYITVCSRCNQSFPLCALVIRVVGTCISLQEHILIENLKLKSVKNCGRLCFAWTPALFCICLDPSSFLCLLALLIFTPSYVFLLPSAACSHHMSSVDTTSTCRRSPEERLPRSHPLP